jgi:hypothetical protein
MSAPVWYQSSLDRFSAESGRIRQRVISADVDSLSADVRRRNELGELKAFVYVWLAAALERCVKDMLQLLVAEINLTSTPAVALVPGLLGLAVANDLEALRMLRDYQKTWPRKCGMFSTVLSSNPVSLDTSVLPLDGRTLRPHHFDVIWSVFGFPGASMPSLLHRFALTDLAEGRNDIAHGDEDPAIFGRKKSMPDLKRLVDRVEDSVLHLALAADNYLQTAQFKVTR